MATVNDKIKCEICGALTHSIRIHLKDDHGATMTEAQYEAQFPGKPLLSPYAEQMIAEKKAGAAPTMVAAATATATVIPMPAGAKTAIMHELFGIDPAANPNALSSRGSGIPVQVLAENPDIADMIPMLNPNFEFDVENLKNALIALECNIPLYVWGHTGTGKTTLIKQIAHRTRRPILRVQHTINTEESHIIGQWVIRNGETVFQLGPLAMAMKMGWTYLADEYDFAMSSVLSVYQPVLEGDALVIKEADEANRVIVPHKDFRFAATGNTNGAGDETGLYQGTQLQNAANYDRFGMVIEQKYLKADREALAIAAAAKISADDAKKLVEFATKIREAYDANQVSAPVSPRALINAGIIGIRRASYKTGLHLAYINKLSKVDRVTVSGIAQRIFR